MALAVHCQFNLQVRPFVPTVMAPKLAYRRGKREGGEEPVSKHQIRSGDGTWERRRGVGRLNPRREAKTKGKNRDREREMREEVTNRRKVLARKRRRRGRADRRLLRQRERRNRARARGREIIVATHNVRTMAVDARSWTGARCFECVRSAGVRRHRSTGDPPQWTFSLQPGWLLGVL